MIFDWKRLVQIPCHLLLNTIIMVRLLCQLGRGSAVRMNHRLLRHSESRRSWLEGRNQKKQERLTSWPCGHMITIPNVPRKSTGVAFSGIPIGSTPNARSKCFLQLPPRIMSKSYWLIVCQKGNPRNLGHKK